ncbi:hypothetical protein A9Q96_04260 [Rhodobacterales bacterium 52_120_T64]|nr:hypothetical protein A9Q96_04260 [Rhodobacterales bacterium 52_120_T64]
MLIKKNEGPCSVRLPDGSVLTRGDLPPKSTTRWVIRHKVKVVLAVTSGLLSLEEACEMYNLSEEEYLLWQSAMLDHGRSGLRVTHLKKYRQP